MIIILNNTAGTAKATGTGPEEIKALVSQQGLRATVWCSDPQTDLATLARRAVSEGAETVVAGGGDGTVNAVAQEVIGSSSRFAVLPLGTLNHFSKDLGMPVKLEEAVASLAAGEDRLVDVAEVNGRLFLNNSSLGLYPRIVRHRDQQREKLGRGKWPAFAWAMLTALRFLPTLRLALQIDGKPSLTRTPFLFVGNNDYHMQGLRIGERDCLDAGELSIYFTRDYGRWGIFLLALRSLIGRLREAKNFEVHAAKSLRVQTNRGHMPVSTDGEVNRLELPLLYQIRPRALRVLGPAKK